MKNGFELYLSDLFLKRKWKGVSFFAFISLKIGYTCLFFRKIKIIEMFSENR